ncbi:helix-turn-helix domain-containing protein [Streptomyces sp. NPDC048751]|uniref:helix-turn-helix domain-containing protein n=1 Tax=Streptomyces sp. NPDC048751 TaxID=3365591 RepID=UPI003721EA28
MGRREAPIDTTVPELGRLAAHLRAMRKAAGWTYEQLAVRAECSSASLKRAASGKHLPDRYVVHAYARACLKDDREFKGWVVARELHERAAKAIVQARLRDRRSTVVPKPELARDLADLSGAMRDAWARAARPTARFMESESKGVLPHSTANAITNGRTVPRHLRQYLAFLQACGIRGRALGTWLRAWVKLRGLPTESEMNRAPTWMEPSLLAQYLDVVRERLTEPQEAGTARQVPSLDATVTKLFTSMENDLRDKTLELRAVEQRMRKLETVVFVRGYQVRGSLADAEIDSVEHPPGRIAA